MSVFSHMCGTCGGDYLLPHKPLFSAGDASESGASESEKDHVCRPGMVCSSWGTPQWYCMHMTSMDYPEKPTDEDKARYREWLENKQYTLPCCCCRAHFAKHLAALDLDNNAHYFDNTQSFFRLVFDIHNIVNKSLGKDELDEQDFGKLFLFYSLSRGVTDKEYGRAFVVVQPAQQTHGNEQSILLSSGLVKDNCGLVSATDPDHACVHSGE